MYNIFSGSYLVCLIRNKRENLVHYIPNGYCTDGDPHAVTAKENGYFMQVGSNKICKNIKEQSIKD